MACAALTWYSVRKILKAASPEYLTTDILPQAIEIIWSSLRLLPGAIPLTQTPGVVTPTLL
jgi:hypothetical protein